MARDHRLAQSLADVEQFLATESNDEGVIAVDTESSSLNLRTGKMAGFSVCFREGVALYVPTGHKVGTNVSLQPAMDLLRKKVETDKLRILHYNAKHDRTVIEKATGWVHPDFLDVLELVYLDNPDREEKSLKAVAREDCGYEMAEFDSLFSPEEIKAKTKDISTKSPTRVKDYACADADGLMRVYHKHARVEKDFAFAVKVDTRIVDIIRRLEYEGGTELDEEYIAAQIKQTQALADELREMIHRQAGQRFEIDSNKQLGLVLFDRLGIPNQGMTAGKNPQYKTDADSLEGLRTAHPIIEHVLSYRKVTKAHSSYLGKLARLAQEKFPIRFNLHTYLAPTFRFAAPGGSPEKDGFTGINIQAVSDGEARDIYAVDLTRRGDRAAEDELDPDDVLLTDTVPTNNPSPGEVEVLNEGEWEKIVPRLPYVLTTTKDTRVCIRDTCKDCPARCEDHGIDTTRRMTEGVKIIPSIRSAIRAPEGWILVSMDYDKQELMIGANISGEQRWLDAFKNGVDLHDQTAMTAYGLSKEAWDKLNRDDRKQKRDVAKIINFLVFYGGDNWTMARRARLAQATADQIYEEFKRLHVQLFAWIAKVHRFARKNGYTTTYLGRRRRLKWIYDKAEKLGGRQGRQMAAFGDRSAVNTCIQGTGAEMARIAIVRVDDRINKAGLADQIKLALMLHDELMYLVKIEVLDQALSIIRDGMEFKVDGWQVQLKVSAKGGRSWGKQQPIELVSAA